MKLKILKGEYLFSRTGTHICDEKGIAIKAQEDTECDVLFSHASRVKELIKADRLNRGLDEDGNPIPPPATEEPIIIEEPSEPITPAEE